MTAIKLGSTRTSYDVGVIRARCSIVMAFVGLGCTPSGDADASAAILEQLEALSRNVGQLEAKVESLEAEVAAADARRAVAMPAPDTSAGESASPHVDLDAIHCEEHAGHRTCTIPRSTLRELLADPTALAAMARIVPAVSDGQAAGFKAYAIRSGSFPAVLGIQNGDTLQTLDGRPFQSVDQAMAFLAALRTDKRAFTLGFERKAAPWTLALQIEP